MKPTVSRLEEEYGDRVEFKAIDIDKAENAEIMRKYRFIGQPQFVIVGANGKVAKSFNGFIEYQTLKASIDKALGQ